MSMLMVPGGTSLGGSFFGFSLASLGKWRSTFASLAAFFAF